MAFQDFIDSWPGLNADARFAKFLVWVDSEVASIEDYLSEFSIIRAAIPEFYTGTVATSINFLINETLFDVPVVPWHVVAGGEWFVSVLFTDAEQKWNKKQKILQELEKEQKKELAKQLEKLAKEGKLKGDPGYADWYYSYWLPKYYGEYGSP